MRFVSFSFMTTTISTEADIIQLAAAFNNATLRLEDFHHIEHLAVALWYCRQDNNERDAFINFRAALLRLLIANGQINAYHETITAFWFELILRIARNYPPASSLIEILKNIPAAYTNSHYIYKYFTKAQLNHHSAKVARIPFQFEP